MDDALLKISSILFLAWLIAGAPIGFSRVTTLQPSEGLPTWKESMQKSEEIQEGLESGAIEADEDAVRLHQDVIDAYEYYIHSDCKEYKQLAHFIGVLMSNSLKNQDKDDLYDYVDSDVREEAGRIVSESLQNGYVIKSDFPWMVRGMIPAQTTRRSACE